MVINHDRINNRSVGLINFCCCYRLHNQSQFCVRPLFDYDHSIHWFPSIVVISIEQSFICNAFHRSNHLLIAHWKGQWRPFLCNSHVKILNANRKDIEFSQIQSWILNILKQRGKKIMPIKAQIKLIWITVNYSVFTTFHKCSIQMKWRCSAFFFLSLNSFPWTTIMSGSRKYCYWH